MAISYPEAVRIAEKFACEIARNYPGRVLAVYAIGSLGSDYYRPGQSDIDTAVITDFSRQEIGKITEEIDKIADTYWKSYNVPKGFGSVVFAREQLYPPYIPAEELVQEILRLKVQFRCIWGHYDLKNVPMPPKTAIIDDARQFQAWMDRERAGGFRIDSAVKLVNSTLIVLKRYLLIRHGIVEFNKFRVIDLYLQNDPPLVHERLFAFIRDWLHDRPGESPDLAGMAAEYDDLCQVINKLVLYGQE